LPFGLFYFDVPQGTPAYPKPRRASLSIEIRLGVNKTRWFFSCRFHPFGAYLK
jgi:hypothetical protein